MRKGKAVETHEREMRALDYRRKGHTYEEISRYMGLGGPGVAYRIIQRAMSKAIVENADEVRAVELDRLDGFLTRLQEKIERGDTKAIDTALRIMDRRAKMLGLDAPTKVQAEVTTHDADSIDGEVARLVALLDSGAPGAVDAPNRAT